VRREGEQRTSAGRILFRRMYLASFLDARSPRGASGRSTSASVESDQLDFPLPKKDHSSHLLDGAGSDGRRQAPVRGPHRLHGWVTSWRGSA
jgi:hypothetical protein